MAVSLSIKKVPDDLVEKLRTPAARHHRSLQGELLAILEAAVRRDSPASPLEVLEEVRRLGLSTPAESVDIIRADRDGRPGG